MHIHAEEVPKCVALFRSSARCRKRGISDLRWARAVSPSAISFRLRMRSMTLVIRLSRTATKAATAPRTKAVAVALRHHLQHHLRKLISIRDNIYVSVTSVREGREAAQRAAWRALIVANRKHRGHRCAEVIKAYLRPRQGLRSQRSLALHRLGAADSPRGIRRILNRPRQWSTGFSYRSDAGRARYVGPLFAQVMASAWVLNALSTRSPCSSTT